MNKEALRYETLTAARAAVHSVHTCTHGDVCGDEACNVWWDCLAALDTLVTDAHNASEFAAVTETAS